MTGIARDTLYSWENGEYRGDNTSKFYKHSDVLKRLREERSEMLEKRMWEEPIGRQSLANNSQTFGLMYNRQNIGDHAAAQQALRSAREIADRHMAALELPEMEKPEL